MIIKDELKNLLEIEESIKTIIQSRNFLGDDSFDKLLSLVAEFVEKKNKIRTDFAGQTHVVIDDINLRKLMQKIRNDEKFNADKIFEFFEKQSGESYNIKELDWNTIENICSSELHSWFRERDYVENMIDIGILIIGTSIPENLDYFLNEAKQCYAFQQHNAVYSLCRTILETAMRDIGLKTGKINRPQNDKDFYREYPPRKLINSVSFGKLREKIHNFYSEISSLIHGYKKINSCEARESLINTLKIIEELHELNNLA